MCRLLGIVLLVVFASSITGCKKSSTSQPAPPPAALTVQNIFIDGTAVPNGQLRYNIAVGATIKIVLSSAVSRPTVAGAVNLSATGASAATALNISYENNDNTIVLQPAAALLHLTKYRFEVKNSLVSAAGGKLNLQAQRDFITRIDSTPKFPLISNEELLTKVQQQTFKYFWDFAHPVSGLARERNSSGDLVTSGGSGFGIMCIPVAIERNFITRQQGLQRMQTIVAFLKNTGEKFHGAFPHWLNGITGKAIAFSAKDDGADLVETSYLIAGLLTARQYFDLPSADEVALRNDINAICNAVEWDWFRRGGQDVLYWHWSPNYGWDMNLPIRGWNECLITYILAAASTTHGIPASVYTNGWAGTPGFKNGNNYYGYTLPLGMAAGGPMFFSHYSFLGINPNGLKDAYADYALQVKNHALVNYSYCVANPKNYFGYSNQCWGLTASDIPNGYTASSPTNDIGVIAPTAALASIAYTPEESMQALKFFYYILGDKIWKDYGFVDAFALQDLWYANSFLAIDQGPIIIMIENYRSGLVWNLLSNCAEVKAAMIKLGFTAPYL
ncbi:MAG TPA: glucoamylase family protein [Ferruginibacter sp.]|mgnify:CR=1 FL=1|nr:glucoamylase family protein [Ferruginibacter sp.]HMP19995.1 glucoamylase family protein [Ferruginibacter sp.]